ncbi:MAG: 30S ribosomal protein S20 [Candidatus Nealsonbacteria bacterium]|nr:30S ribosomal protein S20 [Candidatus Nealsonbacteria bacterium]
MNMPIIKSAKKALRKSQKRKLINAAKTRKLKSLLKEVRVLISEKKIEEAKKLLPQVYKTLDKAAKTKLIKKNTASRKKSRISKSILKSR